MDSPRKFSVKYPSNLLTVDWFPDTVLSSLEATTSPLSPGPGKILKTSRDVYDMASVHSIWRTFLVAGLKRSEDRQQHPSVCPCVG